MTKEEAIKHLLHDWHINLGCDFAMKPGRLDDFLDALDVALSALRGPTREQVEKVWGGEWEEERFAGEHEGWQHRECGRHSTEKTKWCPKCGKAMTDEAVDMVMERLEALYEET